MRKLSNQTTTSGPKTTKRRALAGAALLAAAGLTLTACGGDDGDKKDKPIADVSVEAESKQAATVLDKPFKKPDLVLTDTHGKKYDLRERTKGKPVLLYYGYTNCPDVCPLTMSNIAVAKKDMLRKKAVTKAELDQLQVVFVTTDPERDTSKELGKWLKAQDPEFIGLTGDFPTIQASARTVGISIEPSKKLKNDKIESMHGTQVIAFSPKTDAGYVVYNGQDTRAEEYAQDLPKIIKGQNP
ncbi:SCO family protein [Streptomyces spectabilis]|uniref:Protein SCO1/2 n=1 Tax=Streptomyces spectabilis TaxID=68270 RepID=A0A5P2X7E2_STRST|nr:SCO family protein [Streptomyces spectabilis]MBB5104027.1 protein SCO1/2 [Streptomyces spectabilis]MCI3903739.1 SCO family protein [Streptomyces spectabilis]QEV60917.1 SCO family protein [Streptomyces spectabilis]GGV40130.1 SCO family protein [Streptomyces spectabilis]